MNVKDLIHKLDFEIVCSGATIDSSVEGCFCGDLLSLAMSNIQAKNIWITVQTNVNILGIAALTETSCVIVANGMNIPDNVIEKAKEEDICLLRTKLPAYEVCCRIGEYI